ncbi:hypothetical protein LWI28_010496 [Acer negundo]|uniref:Uncharacterized protein n=1 Tax=Acer negundo TaxID=4023 RepID=A0AAD5IZE7_ACENE|nr:hypothetical protein LWI28_010496 [Acer negundo]
MWIRPVSREVLLCFLVSLLLASGFCHGYDHQKVEVVGNGECVDCEQNNFKTSQAFSGLKVTIDCQPENGEFKTRGIGELDEDGKFTVLLPDEMVEDGKLKEECYAQLHSSASASAGAGTPCPAHGGLESSKIVFKTKNDDKHIFGLPGKLKFLPVTCASALFWPHFKHQPLPKLFLPKFPPLKSFGHPNFKKPLLPLPPILPKSLPPKPPVFEKPLPPPPTPKPFPPKPPLVKPPPIPKVLPPPAPIYKPKPPVPKVLPPKPPLLKPPFPKVLPPKPPLLKPPFPKVLPPKPPLLKPPFPKVLPPHKPPPPPFPKKQLPPLPKLPPLPPIAPHP